MNVHVEYKSGGHYEFQDVTKVEINIAGMLFIDYSDGTRHTEDFKHVQQIRIVQKKEIH